MKIYVIRNVRARQYLTRIFQSVACWDSNLFVAKQWNNEEHLIDFIFKAQRPTRYTNRTGKATFYDEIEIVCFELSAQEMESKPYEQ